MATVPIPSQTRPEPDEELARLQEMLSRGEIRAARSLVTQLEQWWPDLAWVQYYVRVLAPPQVVARRSRSTPSHDREYAWLAEHGGGHPGCWLAVLDDQLIAADPNLSFVLDAVRRTPDAESALLFFQPESSD